MGEHSRPPTCHHQAMYTIALTLALAAPPGFTEVKSEAGCTLFRGPTEADGVAPMRAECHWPEVAPEALITMLGDYAGYDEAIFAITRCEPLRVDGERTLVHQVQTTRGIATREVLLWMQTSEADGATIVAWSAATGEPLELAEGNVRAPRNEGAWEIAAHPDGGSRVVHRIAYDPGGSVPSWVVRQFSVNGMLQVMAEVRAKAASP